MTTEAGPSRDRADRNSQSKAIATRAQERLAAFVPSEAQADVGSGTLPDAPSPLPGETRLTAEALLINGRLRMEQDRERDGLHEEIATLDEALKHDVPPADVAEASYTTGQKWALGTLATVVGGLAVADVYILAELVPTMFNLPDDAWERFAIAGVPAAIALSSAHLAVENAAEAATAVGTEVRMRKQFKAGFAGLLVFGVGMFGMVARLATADNAESGIDQMGRQGFLLFQLIFATGTIVAAAVLRRIRLAWQSRLRKRLAGLRDELTQMPAVFVQQQRLLFEGFAAALALYRSDLVRQTKHGGGAKERWTERNARELRNNWLARELGRDLVPPDEPAPEPDAPGRPNTAGTRAGAPPPPPPRPGPTVPPSPGPEPPPPGPEASPPRPGPQAPPSPPPGPPAGVPPAGAGRAPTPPRRTPPSATGPNGSDARGTPGTTGEPSLSTGDLADVIFNFSEPT